MIAGNRKVISFDVMDNPIGRLLNKRPFFIRVYSSEVDTDIEITFILTSHATGLTTRTETLINIKT
jgi:hypothetical protein